MNNKYYKRSKISESKFRHLITCFALDLTATETAQLSRVSLRSVTSIFDKLRQKIAGWCEHPELFEGTIEVDKSYFGRKQGRGASDKTIAFGILKRGDGCTPKLSPTLKNGPSSVLYAEKLVWAA